MGRVAAGMLVLFVAGCAGKNGGPSTIRGSARLPDCTEAARVDLNGTVWFDEGTATLTSAGCEAASGAVFSVCGLAWAFQQQGNEVEIRVDDEYTVAGRLCGDALHLEGGFWFTVREGGTCDYEDGSEVGIEAGGATLTVTADRIDGTLALRGQCTADYAVVFHN